MKNQTFGMFTAEGNYMVARIATAAEKPATAAGERCNFYL